jgi:hypothetical protein
MALTVFTPNAAPNVCVCMCVRVLSALNCSLARIEPFFVGRQAFYLPLKILFAHQSLKLEFFGGCEFSAVVKINGNWCSKSLSTLSAYMKSNERQLFTAKWQSHPELLQSIFLFLLIVASHMMMIPIRHSPSMYVSVTFLAPSISDFMSLLSHSHTHTHLHRKQINESDCRS